LKHERVTEDVRELAALYALGSLTQHEARSFEMHLQEGCAACRAELRRFERTVAGIGFSAEEIQAPGRIREMLIAGIEREPAPTEAAAAPVQEKKTAPPKPATPPPPEPSSVLFRSQSKEPSRSPGIYAVLIALLVFLGAALYALHSARGTNAGLEAKLATANDDLSNLNILLDSQEEKTARLEQIASIIEKPEMRLARLIEQTPAKPSLGVLFWDTKQNHCLLLGSLASPPPGKAYQLWFVTASARVSAGMIRTDPRGGIFTEVSVPETAVDAALALITLEPGSGSQVPTSPYYAVGRFN
jgi:anti-sigma-K factor RskA